MTKRLLSLANREGMIVLTRDGDFLRSTQRRKSEHGIIYIGEPVRKDNVHRIAENITKVAELMSEKRLLAVVSSVIVELYQLEP